MEETETNGIFDDKIELCPICSSQEEILRHCPFLDPDDEPPVSSGGIPVDSTGIAMASLPDTAQDTARDRGSQDVFHTPPEQQSSQSASEGHGLAIRKAVVETDDENQGFFDFSENAEAAECVDLRDDSQLGFPQGTSNQVVDRTLLAECLDGNSGARIIEISRSKIDNFRISKRELPSKDNSDEPPHKVGNYEDEEGTDEGNKAVNEIAETFVESEKGGEEQPESSVVPSSAIDFLKKVAEIKREIEVGNNFVFDVFKALSKENPVDDSRENVSFLELAKRRGFEFPRPCWWKDDDNEMNCE